MGFIDAIKTCLRKFAGFSGRASRPEYWWFCLFLFVGSIAFSIVDTALFGTTTVETAPDRVTIESNGPLGALFSLAMFIPTLAAGWRRMHDSGRSGLYLLYPLIVMIGISAFLGALSGFGPLMTGDVAAVIAGTGGLILALSVVVFLISPLLVLWWLTRPSQPGTNLYGPNPHEVIS